MDKRIKKYSIQKSLLFSSNTHEQSPARPTHKSIYRCIVQSVITTQTTNNSMPIYTSTTQHAVIYAIMSTKLYNRSGLSTLCNVSIPAQCTGPCSSTETIPLPSLSFRTTSMLWYTRISRPTRHSIGHFGDGERRVFWTKYGRRESMQMVFYHCSRSCVKPRHPYFKSRKLTIVPSLVDKVTGDDIERAKRHGVDLSCVTLKDTE